MKMNPRYILRHTGIAYGLLMAVTLGLVYLISIIMMLAAPNLLDNGWVTWMVSMIPMYAVAMPICFWWAKRLPVYQLHSGSMEPKRWLGFFTMCICIMYVGNLVGNVVNSLIAQWTVLDPIYSLEDMLDTSGLGMTLLFSVIVAPILEELFFRKILIQRTIVMGDKTAIVLSGLMFGLFHGNFYQFFYAFGLGCLFAYVYIRTGKLRNTIALHMAVNFVGGFIPTVFQKQIDIEGILNSAGENGMEMFYVLQGITADQAGYLVLYGLYTVVMILLAVIGFFIFVKKIRSAEFRTGELAGSFGKTVIRILTNGGMWFFFGLCALEFLMNMLPLT